MLRECSSPTRTWWDAGPHGRGSGSWSAPGSLDGGAKALARGGRWGGAARRKGEPLSVGLAGNCADVLPEVVRRGWAPDVLTDQTSAHDELNGYVPAGLTLDDAVRLRS